MPLDVWAKLGQGIVFISSVCGAVMAIEKFVKWMRSRTTIAKLQEKVEEHSFYLENDNKRIKGLEVKLEDSKKDREEIHEVNRLTLTAVQALLKSNLEGGNNREGMKSASDDIQKFLNNLIG